MLCHRRLKIIPKEEKKNPLAGGLKPFMPGGGLYDHSGLGRRAARRDLETAKRNP